ncbi:MAG: hypothetical protein JOZ83_12335 [Silvibacterium sp.]|nr:hypothetical protein [Silvibacterium sp.]
MPGCAICTFTLPDGNRCNAIALRGHAFCRHHNRSPRRIAQDALDVRLARYRRELDAMDLPRFLNALIEKLDLISAVIPAYPEAQLILAMAAHRFALILSNYFDHASESGSEPDLLAILGHEELEKFADSQAQAASWIQSSRASAP